MQIFNRHGFHYNYVKDMDVINNFLKRYEKRSKKTVSCYRSVLKFYFNTIQQKPDTYFKRNKSDIKKDVVSYWNTIVEKPPKTRNAYIHPVKSFLTRNGVEFKTIFWKDLLEEGRGKLALTQDYVPKNKDIKELLYQANIKDKAWILIACSSGMRIGEVIQITEDNLYLDEKPPRIEIPGNITKSGDPRFTFISYEAKEYLSQWLKSKKEYLRTVEGKNNLPNVHLRTMDLNDKRVFPFTYRTLVYHWDSLTDKIGLNERDKQTNRRKLHIHCLRKFAKTRMLLTMPERMCKQIIGHMGYLSREYERFEVSQIMPEYEKAISNLSVMESTPDLSGVHEELHEKDRQINEMQQEMQKIRMELLEVKMKQVQELQRRK